MRWDDVHRSDDVFTQILQFQQISMLGQFALVSREWAYGVARTFCLTIGGDERLTGSVMVLRILAQLGRDSFITSFAKKEIRAAVLKTTSSRLLQFRQFAVLTLASISPKGDREAIQMIIDLLVNDCHRASSEALTIVAERGDAWTLNLLCKLCMHEKSEVRENFVHLVGQLTERNDSFMISRMMELMNDTRWYVRETAIMVLAVVVDVDQPDTKAIDVTVSSLSDECTDVRFIAIKALGEILQTYDHDLLRKIAALLNDVDWDLREAALETMTLVASFGKEIDDFVRQAIINALRDENDHVRCRAVSSCEAMVACGDELQHYVGVLVQMLRDPVTQVQVKALASLENMCEPGDLDVLFPILDLFTSEYPHTTNALRAVQSLAVKGCEQTIRKIASMLRQEDIDIQTYVLRALDLVCEPGCDMAVGCLLEILPSENPDTRIAAVLALSNIGIGSRKAVEAVLSLNDDESAEVRCLAMHCVRNITEERDRPYVVDCLITRLGQPDRGMREIIISGLANMSNAALTSECADYSGDLKIVDALIPSLSDPELVIRRATIEAMQTLEPINNPGVLAKAIEILKDEDASLREESVELIRIIGPVDDKDLISTIVQQSYDENIQVRASCFRSLLQLSKDHPEVIQRGLEALSDEDWGVREEVGNLLAANVLRSNKVVFNRLLDMLQHSEIHIQNTVLGLLEIMEGDDDTDAILSIMSSLEERFVTGDQAACSASLMALVVLKHDRYTEATCRLLPRSMNQDLNVRLFSQMALAIIISSSDEDAVSQAFAIFDESAGYTHRHGVLVGVKFTSPELVYRGLFQRFCRSDNSELQQAATDALILTASPKEDPSTLECSQEVSSYIPTLRKAAGDVDLGVTIEAAVYVAIETIREYTGGEPDVLEMLPAWLGHKNPQVRSSACFVLFLHDHVTQTLLENLADIRTKLPLYFELKDLKMLMDHEIEIERMLDAYWSLHFENKKLVYFVAFERNLRKIGDSPRIVTIGSRPVLNELLARLHHDEPKVQRLILRAICHTIDRLDSRTEAALIPLLKDPRIAHETFGVLQTIAARFNRSSSAVRSAFHKGLVCKEIRDEVSRWLKLDVDLDCAVSRLLEEAKIEKPLSRSYSSRTRPEETNRHFLVDDEMEYLFQRMREMQSTFTESEPEHDTGRLRIEDPSAPAESGEIDTSRRRDAYIREMMDLYQRVMSEKGVHVSSSSERPSSLQRSSGSRSPEIANQSPSSAAFEFNYRYRNAFLNMDEYDFSSHDAP